MSERLQPDTVRGRVTGNDALLVCAYEDEEKCRDKRLEGAITLQEFEARVADLEKDRGIVFY